MASRLAVKRLPAAVSRRCLGYQATPATATRCFSNTTRPLSTALLSATVRKPERFVSAAQILNVQTRSYADAIIKVPQMAESISEGTLKQFSKQVGDFVQVDEEVATIETDKIDVAVNASEAGKIIEFLANEEDTVTVGQDLVKIDTSASPDSGSSKPAESESAKEEPKTESAKEEPKAPAEPKPEEKETSKPSKPAPAPAPKPAEKSAASATPQTPQLGNRSESRVKMNRIRIRIGERLKESQNTAASLTTFNEIDMSSLMQMRSLYKEAVLEKTGIRLGFMSAFARASIKAMEDVPTVNASIEGNDTIVYRDYVDISVAVATEKGLVTPVVRNAEALDMVGIEKAIADLATKAKSNKLTIEDMAGGTFTISNGGVFGSLFGTPIINLPQTAVLGLHAIKEKPVAVNGQVVIRPVMVVALTYDHRLLDGKEAVTFLVKIKNYIEDPRRLLLGV